MSVCEPIYRSVRAQTECWVSNINSNSRLCLLVDVFTVSNCKNHDDIVLTNIKQFSVTPGNAIGVYTVLTFQAFSMQTTIVVIHCRGLIVWQLE